ncbi:MerR family transcriptional regulator [Pseudomonas sp. UBA6562]|uniref:MerR family transcriptional regulator n=1 Tax=Pseudomonas sp. UBA6562 TaxID=1947332 RepID=UPI0025ED0F12|nr:MerR family transcriptional regulator [Pseudomonas sp. UBA6562]
MNQRYADCPAQQHQEPVLHSIGEVARDTGVNAVTLRAWERRHGLLQPTRTDTGHRLYSQADIDTIHSIQGWLKRGVPVSRIARILARGTAATQALADGWHAQARAALADFDRLRLAEVHRQALAALGQDALFEQVWMPLWTSLRGVGQAYGQVSEGLFLDQFLRHQVLEQLREQPVEGRLQVLVAPLNEQAHKLELLVAGLLLSDAQTAVTVLPLGQPLAELALICERRAADALVLVAHHHRPAELGGLLAKATRGLTCPLALAGEVSESAEPSLRGGPVAGLGAQGAVMRRRLRSFLAGQLDT